LLVGFIYIVLLYTAHLTFDSLPNSFFFLRSETNHKWDKRTSYENKGNNILYCSTTFLRV